MVLKPSLRLLQSDPNPNPKFAKVPGGYQSPEQPRHLPAAPAELPRKVFFPTLLANIGHFLKVPQTGRGVGRPGHPRWVLTAVNHT